MKPLNIALSIIPLLAVAIGMITWVVSLRSDLDTTQGDITALRASLIESTGIGERLVAVETHMNDLPDTTLWRNDVAERVVALESVPPLSVEGYDDSWVITRLDEFTQSIESLRDRELDTGVADRLSDLSREVSTVTARVDGIDVSGFGDIAARLAGMEAIVSTIDGGEIDLTPLVTRLAEVEGKLNALPTGTSYDDSGLRRQIATLQGSLSSLQSTVRSLPSSSGAGYDDSGLRRQIATIQGSVSALESTVRRLPTGTTYDDSSLRRLIGSVQNELTTLEGQVDRLPTSSSSTTYNDGPIQASVSSLQTSLAQIQGEVASLSSQVNNQPIGTDHSGEIANLESWVQDLDYKIGNLPTASGVDYGPDIQDLKNELGWLGDTFEYVFDELRRIEAGTSSGGNTITSTPEKLYVTHSNSGQYTGSYVHQGSFNGYPMWVCEECGPTSGQFATAYIFRYPVGFTMSGWVWVIQPIPPSTDWSANSYDDGSEWPWEGLWSGDIQSVTAQ